MLFAVVNWGYSFIVVVVVIAVVVGVVVVVVAVTVVVLCLGEIIYKYFSMLNMLDINVKVSQRRHVCDY